MRALLYSDWNRLELADVPDPDAPGSEEVRLRVAACGICGSELDAVRHRSPRRPPPRVMGHEFCGVVEDVGSSVRDWKRGDRVIAHALVHCGTCDMCRAGRTNLCVERGVFGMQRPGAFAEQVLAPASALMPWPAGLPAAIACMSEPLANGINAIRLDATQARERVVVLGAGPIGLMCVLAARVIGGGSVIVTDLIPERRQTALRLGAERAIDPRQEDLATACRALWNGQLPTYVVDAVGTREAKRQAVSVAATGGTIIWLGLVDNALEMDAYDLTMTERRIIGSYSGPLSYVRDATNVLAGPSCPPMDWVQVFPLDAGVDAFERMLAAKGGDIKAVLQIAPDIT